MALIAATTATALAVAIVAVAAAEEVWPRRGWMCRVSLVVVARTSQKPFGDFTQLRGTMFLTLS